MHRLYRSYLPFQGSCAIYHLPTHGYSPVCDQRLWYAYRPEIIFVMGTSLSLRCGSVQSSSISVIFPLGTSRRSYLFDSLATAGFGQNGLPLDVGLSATNLPGRLYAAFNMTAFYIIILFVPKTKQITFGKGVKAAILRAPHHSFCRGIGLHFAISTRTFTKLQVFGVFPW